MGIAVSATFTERGIAARRAAPTPAVEPEPFKPTPDITSQDWFRNISLIVEAPRHPKPKAPPTLESILRRFVGVNGITYQEIVGQSHHPNVVLIRHAAMYWMRRRTGKSCPMIGNKFGGKDHATVLSAVRKYPQKRALAGRYVAELNGAGPRKGAYFGMADTRFTKELRDLIKANGISATAVSQKAFGTQNAVNSWLSEGRLPRLDNFEAALNVVGMTIKIVPLEEKA